ncbi:MAG: hypothetical protein A3G33_04045 [Omnitrophica bacterium RIFCSPLOWO2_12_FULL_44_17]|uniref:Uncharacterized protein n=1 Tax=Candidatus Danuiimicrobium aquiferis TaxID=1801832 RepID=A0A1G1KZD9_9BACT|nr:MAG: hypothetical protein A3B72_10250 [Omnitrophica bacterium RIFCSPHIGHO2_02_FULL_45_28]OGW98268.1 MAG: hypothetical protein A3G33_04045 [Omnitrophica bacterium RIFCSPLOWO2_12_FULL_44_17]OGX01830.1 MAG: hypothetical protein A3J12_06975 [Omnitrophica bacterium RIFCSPLOWO2_02_FULL_44_11]
MIRILLLCFIISMFSGCGGCGKSGEQNEHEQVEQGEGAEAVLHLKEESQRLVGLEVSKVRKTPYFSSLKVVGEIAQETEKVFHVTASQPGFLKLFLKQVGETVEKGTPLCVIQIKTDETIEVVSPAHGIVFAQYVKAGEKVDSLTSIMTVTDTDLLRVSFNVYEKDIAGIQLGEKVIVESVAYPDKEFEGEIVFVSPSVDTETRAIKIRGDVKNEEHLLKFGMFVSGEIISGRDEKYLSVPTQAVQTIDNEEVVFIKTGNEEFVIRKIKVKAEAKEKVFIEDVPSYGENSQLKEGDEVVAKGSFLLKSELLKGELEGE